MKITGPIAQEIDSDLRAVEHGLSRGVILLLAITVGAAVANRYYIEPLLSLVSRAFRVPDAVSELLVTSAQLGYVLGLALIVPLGDLLDRRRLVAILLFAAGLAALGCALSQNFVELAAALLCLGLFSVAAQILVPHAAALAPVDKQGRVVGIVTSGLLIGVLTARTLSGFAGGLGGFRLIFALAALTMVLLSLLLWRALPTISPTEDRSYPALLYSIWELIFDEPVLRQRMALAFLHMASFTVLWAPSAFVLSGPPYHYDTSIIGLFGLAGAAGALVAPLAGHLGDRGHGSSTVTVSLVVMLASWIPLAMALSSLTALIIGMVLLDFGFQCAHVNHQRIIFSLHPAARSRLNTAYMVAFFLGGVFGSLLSTAIYGHWGWVGNCILGALLALTALVVWATTRSVEVAASIRILSVESTE